jgi:hypothetical protein
VQSNITGEKSLKDTKVGEATAARKYYGYSDLAENKHSMPTLGAGW